MSKTSSVNLQPSSPAAPPTTPEAVEDVARWAAERGDIDAGLRTEARNVLKISRKVLLSFEGESERLPLAVAAVKAPPVDEEFGDIEFAPYILRTGRKGRHVKLHKGLGCPSARTLAFGDCELCDELPQPALYNSICGHCWPNGVDSDVSDGSESPSSLTS